MAKTAKIKLGGTEYTIHAFNIGELEQVAAILGREDTGASSKSFSLLKLALLRAEPSVGDVDSIEPDTLDEVLDAAKAIMALAGLTAPGNPPATAPAEA